MAKTKAKTKGKPTTKAKPAVKKKPAPTKAKKAAPAKPKKAAKKAAPVKKKVAPASRTPKKPLKPAPKKAVAKQPAKKAPAPKPVPVKKAPVAAKPVKPAAAAAKPAAAPPTKAPKPPAPPAVVPAKPAEPKVEAAAEKPAPKAPAKAKVVKEKEPVIAVMTGLEPLGAPARTLKRAMKERFVMEFYMNATPGSLYDLLSSPSGLSEWFCDDVDVRGEQFTFRWGADSQTAQCLSRKFGELMRFQWEDDEDPGAYFELRIRIDPMTNETCLLVTDHCWPKDLEESKALWESQIHTLQRVLGA